MFDCVFLILVTDLLIIPLEPVLPHLIGLSLEGKRRVVQRSIQRVRGNRYTQVKAVTQLQSVRVVLKSRWLGCTLGFLTLVVVSVLINNTISALHLPLRLPSVFLNLITLLLRIRRAR